MSVTSPDAPAKAHQQRIVLVTGPSGAGRSTAVNALEDLDCEVIDNLPLSMVPRLLDGPFLSRTLVLGIDARNREFSTARLLGLIGALRGDRAIRLEVLYLDCRPDVLQRRYSETRRRHPLAPAETPAEGIAREVDLLAPVLPLADILVDTSDLTPHELRAALARVFTPAGQQPMALTLHSFSYKRGLPQVLDMALDVRFLRNPYWQTALRPLDGRDLAVVEHIAGDPRWAGFLQRLEALMGVLLPAYLEEGKAHLSVGFGCTGGQHRSVAVAERMAATLTEAGWGVSLRHHELDRLRRAPAGARPGDAA